MSKKGLVKMIAGCLAVVMTAATVMAAPSPTKNGAVSQDFTFTINGEKADPSNYKAEFKTDLEDLGLDKAVLDTIKDINKDPEKVKDILTDSKTLVAEDDDIDVSKLEMLTQIQDLSIVDAKSGDIVKDAKDVTMTWEVTNLKEGIGEVRVLHYSTTRNVWEVLKPEKVDFQQKAITQEFEDLSPVAVVYVPANAK